MDMEEPPPVSVCLCGTSTEMDPDVFMILCDICHIWYHGRCVGVTEYMSTDIDKYHCPKCDEEYGPMTMKPRINSHRHDYSEQQADSKPVQSGTPVFIRELKSRHFPKADEIIKHLKGQQLTMQYLQTNGFDVPIMVETKDGLDIVVPPPNFTLHDVAKYVGADREIDVIDVTKQSNISMKLGEFVEYYYDPNRKRILNVISLEFSSTGLSPLVEAPYIARKLDWVNYAWPRDWPADSELKKPEVQKYCLMGVKDSFTDFHIDFGGTSVWYHVLRGEKIFYLIRPTAANLQLYQQWTCSATQSETFFGDQVDNCYKCVIKQGQTMLIPTGWIHAVLTPVDSLVFGGNFIHNLNIPMQIQIYDIEKKTKTPAKFQYPGFETIHWFAAKRLLKELKDLNVENKKCPAYLLQGMKALLSILKQWNTDKDYNMLSRLQIPNTINSSRLLKDFSKEIRHAEKFLMSLNPPKPERESKRKKKKPVNKDFVDFKTVDRSSESPKAKTPAKEKLTKKQTSAKSKASSNANTLKISLPKPDPMPIDKLSPPFPEQPPLILPGSPMKKTIKTLSPKKPTPKRSGSKKGASAGNVQNVLKSPSPKKSTMKKSPTKSKNANKSKNTAKNKLKLGEEDTSKTTKVVPVVNDMYGNFSLDQGVETRKELTWQQTTSVYDFHDGSNESDYGGFTIDEAPKRKRAKAADTNPKRLKKLDPVVETATTAPKNGIEELLKASIYTQGTGTNPRLEQVLPSNIASSAQSAPATTGASPSTRDAIAGMLSFTAQCYSTTSHTSPVKSGRVIKKKEIEEEVVQIDDDLIENIDKVHQDDDFIYPALDVSDDDDEFGFKNKGKKEEDESWNPKARVGPLLPKTNRPAREGAKKTSVEKGLEAAAKKKSKATTTPKRIYKRKKKDTVSDVIDTVATEEEVVPGPSLPDDTNETSSLLPTEPTVSGFNPLSPSMNPFSNYKSVLTSPNRLKEVKAKLAAPIPSERKPKKGMKTVKQRLGKILKLHKMWH
ncbi:hypothetical protein TKK_0011785 [Trichogramma kaykai]|uniref:[Histone H3]-dimethyl-L-lysine(36) demethylase n=1 Tax=Trichogramma kaykai TaxID=54128 RepID=A0ABD2WPT7_9HYME